MGDYLYILKGNSLLRAHADTWQIDRELSREDGLSGNQIIDLCYSYELNRLAIVYANGLIDVMHEDGSIWTIPDLYNAPMAGIDKTILSVREQEGQLFVHTMYGFGVADLDKQVFVHNFNFGFPVSCAWYYGDYFFYSNDSGIFYCPRLNSNPYLTTSWTPTKNAYHIEKAIVIVNNGKEQCWLLRHDKKLCRIYPGETNSWPCYSGGAVSSIQRSGRYIMASTPDSLVFFNTDLGLLPTDETHLKYGQRIACRQSSPYVDGKAIDICPLNDNGDSFGLLYSDSGLYADTIVSSSARTFETAAIHEQPLSSDNHQQSGQINRVVCSPNGEVAMSYVPTLSVSYGTMIKTNGFLTTVGTDGEWTNLAKECVTDYITIGNKRFCAIDEMVADPLNPSRYWFGTLEDGIIGIDHGKLYEIYNKSTTNGSLDVCSPNCTRIGGIGFSRKGDMWCIDEGVTYGLRALCKADGKWYKFTIPGLEKSYGFTHLCVTQRNGRNQVWACQQFKYEVTNVFCYDYGEKIADTSDDRCIYFKTLLPDHPGASSVVPYYNRGIYEGPTGAIWLLNTSGIYIIDNPDDVFTHPGEVHQVLGNVIPTSMTIDSQNNVWVSTEDNGIYLFTADGRQQLCQFTAANSILPSDEVLSVTYQSATSTLWIISTGQILTYRYDSNEFDTDPQQWTTQVFCHPAKVTLGSPSTVNVFGLKDDAEITVTNSQGRILHQDTALGGIINIDTQSYPVGTYTVSGIDKEGHRGHLVTFEVEP